MRHRRGLVGGAVILVVLFVAAGAVAVTGLRGTTPTTALGAPHFVEEAGAAGVDHTFDGDFRFAVGGGIATFDCDEDGRPDLYIAGGAHPAALYRNRSPVGGALQFGLAVDTEAALTDVEGAYPLDIDGDDHLDLAVLRAGESVLLRGLGDCRFEKANEAWSFDGGKDPATAFSATWEASARLPTLALGRYLHVDEAGVSTSQCAENTLLRPAAGGTGYQPPIMLAPGFCALSMLFSDWDRSGRRDLRVSNDREFYPAESGQEQLWRIAAGEPPRLYSDADGWAQLQIEGMGIATYDLTGDGYPEVFLTSQGPNRLQSLLAGPAQPTYRDIGLKRGVYTDVPFTGGDALPSTAWHPEFVDVNNDAFADLFISKGNVDEQPGHAMKDPSNLLLGQPDGTFREGAEAAGVVSFARGRGASLADLNLDGLPDLVEVNYRDRVMVWRNVGSGTAEAPAPMGHWLAVSLNEPGPNRDAIGAWIEMKVGDMTTRRELTVGGGHLSGASGPVHFGLGAADKAQVRVQWPDGEVGSWLSVRADRRVVIERGATDARELPTPAPASQPAP